MEGFKFNMIYLALRIPQDTCPKLVCSHPNSSTSPSSGPGSLRCEEKGHRATCRRDVLQIVTYHLQLWTWFLVIVGEGHQDQCTGTSTPACQWLLFFLCSKYGPSNRFLTLHLGCFSWVRVLLCKSRLVYKSTSSYLSRTSAGATGMSHST